MLLLRYSQNPSVIKYWFDYFTVVGSSPLYTYFVHSWCSLQVETLVSSSTTNIGMIKYISIFVLKLTRFFLLVNHFHFSAWFIHLPRGLSNVWYQLDHYTLLRAAFHDFHISSAGRCHNGHSRSLLQLCTCRTPFQSDSLIFNSSHEVISDKLNTCR